MRKALGPTPCCAYGCTPPTHPLKTLGKLLKQPSCRRLAYSELLFVGEALCSYFCRQPVCVRLGTSQTTHVHLSLHTRQTHQSVSEMVNVMQAHMGSTMPSNKSTRCCCHPHDLLGLTCLRTLMLSTCTKFKQGGSRCRKGSPACTKKSVISRNCVGASMAFFTLLLALTSCFPVVQFGG